MLLLLYYSNRGKSHDCLYHSWSHWSCLEYFELVQILRGHDHHVYYLDCWVSHFSFLRHQVPSSILAIQQEGGPWWCRQTRTCRRLQMACIPMYCYPGISSCWMACVSDSIQGWLNSHQWNYRSCHRFAHQLRPPLLVETLIPTIREWQRRWRPWR